jgi:hypothetical protein
MALVVNVGHPSDLEKVNRIRAWYPESNKLQGIDQLCYLAEKCLDDNKYASAEVVIRMIPPAR